MNIEGPAHAVERECEQILRSLPQWFGIEESLCMYVRDTARMPTFVLRDESRVVAFISLLQHFPHAWEVHCIAVHADARNRGLGRKLLAHAESWLGAQGAWLLQVKTIAPTCPDPHYAETYGETGAFYAQMGFVPLEVFPELWSAKNPCLQLVKVIGGAPREREPNASAPHR